MNKNAFTAPLILFKNLVLVLAVAWLLPGAAHAQVTGAWNTTGLTRTDVTPIKAPGLQPEHTVDIADSSYNFKVDTRFVAGDITGTWKQRKNQYTIIPNRLGLENLFRQSLENQGLIVHQIKMVKSRLIGNQLDNGIWGSESYEYKLDTTNPATGFRDVIRLVQTVKVAGRRPAENTAKKATVTPDASDLPAHSPLDAAADAVIRYMSHH